MFIHGFPPEWSTFKKLIWLVGAGIAGASYIWKTVTGSIIHITDALASPMQKCEVTLEPIQDLHGQDAPYPAGGGANKFDSSHATGASSGQAYGLTISINSDGESITASGTPTWTTTGAKQFRFFSLSDAYTHGYKTIYFLESKSSNISGISSSVFSADSGNTFAITITVTDVNEINFVVKPFVYSGDTPPTTYAPYSNICPITGWTGCEVRVSNENLIDVAPSGGSIKFCYYGTGFLLKKDVKYTLKHNGTSAVAVYFRTPTDTAISNDDATITGDGGIRARCTPKKDILVCLKTYAASSSAYPDDFILELTIDEDSTQVVEHQGTTASVTFPDTVFGGKYNFVDGDGDSEFATAVFDGSEDEGWSLWGGAFVTYGTTPKIATSETVSSTEIIVRADRYKPGGVNYRGAQGSGEIVKVIGVNSYIAVDPTGFADVNAFKAYLASNPMQVVYRLDEPTKIQLTPQPISTLKGENNIWSNSNGDTTIIYKAQA